MSLGSATSESGACSGLTAEHSLVRALRYRADEVQLGRVLQVVARDGGAAPAIAEAILESVPREFQRRAAKHLPVPPDTTCVDQRALFAEVGRITFLKRYRAMGAIDLEFSSRMDWRLGVELKLESDYQPKQRENYLASGRPLVTVVRRPTRSPVKTDTDRWLGEVTWQGLVPKLREVEVGPSLLALQWKLFLDVVSDSGDFDEKPRPASSELLLNKQLLESVREDLIAHFLTECTRGRGLTGDAAPNLIASKARRQGQTTAQLRLAWKPALEVGEVFVELSDASSGRARARTWWVPRRRPSRRTRQAHQKLRGHRFDEMPNGQFVAEDDDLISAAEVATAVNRRVTQIVRSGCLGDKV
jgi:hypothetical protein